MRGRLFFLLIGIENFCSELSDSFWSRRMNDLNAFSIDVEDRFHILDSPAVPSIEQWPDLESRIERNTDRILDLLGSFSVKATFFWLGLVAQRHKSLVRRCYSAGHEIASHGYAHVIAYRVGKETFKNHIERGKKILEDITGGEVMGCRTAGFSITDDSKWAFNVIAEVGYKYDSSIFPMSKEFLRLTDCNICYDILI